MEEKNFKLEEVIQRLKEERVFTNLSDDGLRCLDNIVNNLIKLKELQLNDSSYSMGSLWFLFVMYLLSGPMSEMASLNTGNNETN